MLYAYKCMDFTTGVTQRNIKENKCGSADVFAHSEVMIIIQYRIVQINLMTHSDPCLPNEMVTT